MEWLEPWYPIADDAEQARWLAWELSRELSAGHVLFGLPARAIGRRQDCDDVLFSIEDGSSRVAVVHLTWPRSAPERPPWPGTAVYASFEEWIALGMRAEHEAI